MRCKVRLPGNDGMIRDITISAKGTGDDQYHEPPARVLSLAVIGGGAHLAIYDGTAERAAGPAVTAEVPARSLLQAPDRRDRRRPADRQRRQHPRLRTPHAQHITSK